MNIPSFINRRELTISRAYQSDKDGHVQSLDAVDPEGDTLTLTKWTGDNGQTTAVPDSNFTVTYTAQGAEGSKPHEVGMDEAYDLYSGLKRAKRVEDPKLVDAMAIDFLIGDLTVRGGIGGAA
jgi:hypothetical protein